MLNLIRKFIDDIEDEKVFLLVDEDSYEYEGIYFFQGKESVLCISNDSDKVLHNLKYKNLMISILGEKQFSFNINGEEIFLSMDKDLDSKAKKKEIIVDKQDKVSAESWDRKVKKTSPFEFKDFCDRCTNKKCLEYDTLHGMKHKFGSENMSEDLKAQYNMYCQKKIKKLGCM